MINKPNFSGRFFQLILVALISIVTAVVTTQFLAGYESSSSASSTPVSTAFTYQGQLKDSETPVTGVCDFQFSLYDTPSNGNQIGNSISISNVSVSEGLFTVQPDFGANAFDGESKFLEIKVRCPSDSGDYSTLNPRQELTATPYAIYALHSNWNGLTNVPEGFIDGIDNDTVYNAGIGLILSNETFSLTATYQLPQSCTIGQHPEWDGNSWVCNSNVIQGDNCSVIQQALDNLPTQGGEIIISTGTFTCTSPIIIDQDNVMLRGQGASTLLYLADGANAPVLIIGQPVPNPTIIRKNIRVSDLSIDGNRANQTQECWGGPCDTGGTTVIRNNGVTIRHAQDVLVTEVAVVRARSGGLVTEKISKYLTVQNFTTSDNEFDGIAGYETENSTFSNLILRDNQSAGLSLDLNFNHNLVSEAIIENSGSVGIFMVNAHDNTFQGVQIRESQQHGIFLAEGTSPELTATGNTFIGFVITKSTSGEEGFCVDGFQTVGFCINNSSAINNMIGGTQFIGFSPDCIRIDAFVEQFGIICR